MWQLGVTLCHISHDPFFLKVRSSLLSIKFRCPSRLIFVADAHGGILPNYFPPALIVALIFTICEVARRSHNRTRVPCIEGKQKWVEPIEKWIVKVTLRISR